MGRVKLIASHYEEIYRNTSLGKKLGQVCLEAFDNKEDEFGKTVINILEREYSKSSLKKSFRVSPLSERKLAHSK